MRIIQWIKNILFYVFLFALIFALGSSIYAHFNLNTIELTPPTSAYNPPCNQDSSIRMNEKQQVVKILFISGGGMSGIIPLTYLNYIEKKSNKKSHELFDVFSGTSTGSIIVSSLNVLNNKTKQAASAQDVLNLYIKFSDEAMNSAFHRRFFTLYGLLGPIFDIRMLHARLAQYLGQNTQYKMLLKPVFLSAFNMNTAKIEFFNQGSCHHNMRFGDFYIADILSATCAAPSIFSSVTFYNPGNEHRLSYIDAGVISNNPFPYVFKQIMQMYPNAKKYIFVYLDTGNFHIKSMKLHSRNFNRWGYVEWAEPLIRMLFESQVKHIHQGILNLLDYFPKDKISYYYFSTDDRGKSFDTSKENIEFISHDAQEHVQKNQKQLDKLVKELLESST